MASAFAQDSLRAIVLPPVVEYAKRDTPAEVITSVGCPFFVPTILNQVSPFTPYSTSAGFTSYNAKGFANSFSYGLRNRFDGADNYSAIFNAPLGELLFNSLDVSDKKNRHSVATGNFGSFIGGSSENPLIDPFDKEQFTISQQSGANANGGLYNRSQFRYAQAYGKRQRVAINLSGEFDLKQEWTYDSSDSALYGNRNMLINLNAILRGKMAALYCDTCAMTPEDHDKYVKLSTWLDFNPVASNFDTSVKAGFIQFPVSGFPANSFMSSRFKNAKVNAGLHFKLSKEVQLSLAYRFAMFSTIVQPFFRYQLKDYTVHQPKIELKGPDFSLRTYLTVENSGNSYNLERTSLHLTKSLVGQFAADYTTQFYRGYFNTVDTLTRFCADCIEEWQIDSARNAAKRLAEKTVLPQQGNSAFDNAFTSITQSSDLATGSGWKAMSKTFYVEGAYGFGFQRWLSLSVGATYQLMMPANNEWSTGEKKFHHAGVYLTAEKAFWKERFKLFGSGKFNYNTDFGNRGDYRAGFSFHLFRQTLTLATGSGYVLPTFAQRYTNLQLSNPRFYGSNSSSGTWYSLKSVQNMQQAYIDIQDFEEALSKLKTFTVHPLKPQVTRTIELTLQNDIAQRVLISTTAYFNWVNNTTARVSLVNPNADTITNGIVGAESGETNIASGTYTPFITWSNLPLQTNSWGLIFNITYLAPYGIRPYLNYQYFGHRSITTTDSAIITFNDFNTPMHKVNTGVRGVAVWKGFGFALDFHWLSSYDWQTDFSKGAVPSYHTMDIMVEYRFDKIYSIFSLGANNIYNNRHKEIPGNPRVGAWYYAGWKFDLDLKAFKKQ